MWSEIFLFQYVGRGGPTNSIQFLKCIIGQTFNRTQLVKIYFTCIKILNTKKALWCPNHTQLV